MPILKTYHIDTGNAPWAQIAAVWIKAAYVLDHKGLAFSYRLVDCLRVIDGPTEETEEAWGWFLRSLAKATQVEPHHLEDDPNVFDTTKTLPREQYEEEAGARGMAGWASVSITARAGSVKEFVSIRAPADGPAPFRGVEHFNIPEARASILYLRTFLRRPIRDFALPKVASMAHDRNVKDVLPRLQYTKHNYPSLKSAFHASAFMPFGVWEHSSLDEIEQVSKGVAMEKLEQWDKSNTLDLVDLVRFAAIKASPKVVAKIHKEGLYVYEKD